MTPNRQAQLDAVLHELSKQPGFASVKADDFDSAGINVFIELEPAIERHASHLPVYQFAVPQRRMKANVRRVCEEHGVAVSFLDWPVKRYSNLGNGLGKMDEGYSQTHYKVELHIPEPAPPSTPPDPQLTLGDYAVRLSATS
jgi:hypothetical protein